MLNIKVINCWELIAQCESNTFDAIISDPPYDAILNMEELRRVCKGHIILFCDPLHRFFEPDERIEWRKPSSTKNNSKRLSRFTEEIIIERHGETYNSNLHWANYRGYFEDTLLYKPRHPYEKPISLMERLIAIYTKVGDVIFDPFAGSGATLKAAEKLERLGFGCEIDKQYEYLWKEG